MRWILRNCLLARAINSYPVQVILPPFAFGYFLTLDVWGDKIPFIQSHIKFHQYAFGGLLFLTLLTQAFKATADRYAPRIPDSYYSFLEGFMTLTAKLVGVKLDRFKRAAPHISERKDVFRHITRPDAQIRYILDQSVGWIRDSFVLGEEQISITIMRITDGGSKSYFPFYVPASWQRTKASVVLQNESAAQKCLESGQPYFNSDKRKAEKRGEYFQSKRDLDSVGGSIYCYPSIVETPGPTEHYVITITSYGKAFCSASDKTEQRIAERILREICHRLDIELTLLSMRQYRYKETNP